MEQRLETFLTLCETMHYGRAAERLHLSQPAVSKHIQSLEREYGAELFTYANRRLHKTRQGEILEQYAQSLRYNEEGLLERMMEQPKKLLRLGATKSIGEYTMLPYIERFLAEPGNEIEFLVDNTANLLEMLNRSELDFVLLEGIFDKSHYAWRLFKNEAYVGICAEKHPFAGRELCMAELFGERLILREKGSGTRNILERELESTGYTTASFKSKICISSFEIIKSLVRNGCGISFLYEAVANSGDGLAKFTCPPLTGVHEFNVVYLKNTNAGETAERFLGK